MQCLHFVDMWTCAFWVARLPHERKGLIEDVKIKEEWVCCKHLRKTAVRKFSWGTHTYPSQVCLGPSTHQNSSSCSNTYIRAAKASLLKVKLSSSGKSFKHPICIFIAVISSLFERSMGLFRKAKKLCLRGQGPPTPLLWEACSHAARALWRALHGAKFFFLHVSHLIPARHKKYQYRPT